MNAEKEEGREVLVVHTTQQVSMSLSGIPSVSVSRQLDRGFL